ncbi:MAG: gamma-glutamylcyclotransferase [Acuticoccus sp.]
MMTLTPDLVALSIRAEPELPLEPGWTIMSDDELGALATRYDRECGAAPLWVFAYGSLIWKPGFETVAHKRATAYGWHRSFCLRLTRWRGTPEQPGLMMALERGGRCDGIIYRMPEEGRHAQIKSALLREVRFHQTAHMVRWINVRTEDGPMRVLTFWAGPTGDRVMARLPLDEVAFILARACGSAGSCAEYLYNTVAHLEDFSIRDRNLWRLQQLVAQELAAIHATR